MESSRDQNQFRNRISCPSTGCHRKFLSHRSLQQHLDSNPSCRAAALDQNADTPSFELSTGPWVEFSDRHERPLQLPEKDADVSVEYVDGAIQISGTLAETVDPPTTPVTSESTFEYERQGDVLFLIFTKP